MGDPDFSAGDATGGQGASSPQRVESANFFVGISRGPLHGSTVSGSGTSGWRFKSSRPDQSSQRLQRPRGALICSRAESAF